MNQAMAQDGASSRVTCPTCRQDCELTGSKAEGLSNNLHALHIIRLTNEKKNKQWVNHIFLYSYFINKHFKISRFWCEKCKGLSSPLCQQKKHKLTDFLIKEAEEHDTLVVKVESGAQEALDKRNEGEKPLVIEQDQLQAKLDAVKAKIKENRVHKEKLMAVIANCQKMKQLPHERKGSSFIRDNLKQALKEVEEELRIAGECLNQTTTTKVSHRDEFYNVSYIN